MLILTNVQAVPSRLTVSRLEQVPELPKDYGLQKLLAGGGAMEPPNDTSRWGPGHDHIYIFLYIISNISMYPQRGEHVGNDGDGHCVRARHGDQPQPRPGAAEAGQRGTRR